MARKPKAPTEVQLEAPPPPVAPPPCRFSQVLGQSVATRTLEEACRSNHIHHCWIFHGPTGVGKFRAALAFASIILDPTSAQGLTGEFGPDPNSPTQQLLAAGVHPDLHIVTKELARFSEEKKVRDSKLITIAKDVIEQHVIEPAKLAPNIRTNAAAAKVFIIDEAELLDRSPTNAPVQNSLLKTLEEPPERTVIILVTSNEAMLLPTIRSRAQRVGFARLREPDMRRWLRTLEEPPDPEATEWLLAFADGSPGVFTSAREATVHEWWKQLSPMLARIRSGHFVLEAGPAMSALIDKYAEDWVDTYPQASKESANHAGAEWMYCLLGHWLHNELARVVSSEEQSLRILAAVDAIRLAESHTASNVSAAFAMEALAARLASCFAGEREFVA